MLRQLCAVALVLNFVPTSCVSASSRRSRCGKFTPGYVVGNDNSSSVSNVVVPALTSASSFLLTSWSTSTSTEILSTASASITSSRTAEPSPTSSTPATTETTFSTTSSDDTGSDSNGSNGSRASDADVNEYLSAHNTIRAQHGASDLVWNNTLAAAAQKWSDGCVFQHSGGSLGPFGENLAAGTGSSYGITSAVSAWTDEVSDYNPSNPSASHFTQVVWKGSTQLGCAETSCAGGTIFSDSSKYVVCEYFPQGNVIGAFAENVQA